MDNPGATPSTLLPAAVFPLHDPDGSFLEHRRRITPQLKEIFSCAVVSVSPATEAGLEELAQDPFFVVVRNPVESSIGEYFLNGYRRAAEVCPPEQQLHLCFQDRLAYALETGLSDAFVRDVQLANHIARPVLFQRSPAAWLTHPRTYFAIESMATRVGEVLFGRSLDFAWCHLALRAGQLKETLPRLDGIRDLSLLAAIVLALKDEIVTREVDWLAWEDPFIMGRDAEELKAAQEANPADVERRLGYVTAMVKLLLGNGGCQRIRGTD